MGTSLKVSTPPAMTVEAFPARIFSTALVMATLDEMHAYIIAETNVSVSASQENKDIYDTILSHHSHSMSPNTRWKSCINCRLSCDIARPNFLNDIARQDVVYVLFVQCCLRNETLVRQPL